MSIPPLWFLMYEHLWVLGLFYRSWAWRVSCSAYVEHEAIFFAHVTDLSKKKKKDNIRFQGEPSETFPSH